MAARKRALRLRIRNVSSQPASERASRKKGCHKHILFNVIAFLRSAAVPAAPPDDDAAI